MLQIDEWFRKPVRKTTVVAPVAGVKGLSPKKTDETDKESLEKPQEEYPETDIDDMFEPEPVRTRRSEFKPKKRLFPAKTPEKTDELEQPMNDIEVSPVEAGSMAETEELEQITEKIGLDVSDMIDMEKEDVLLKQIDEFREKAKQLQELMNNRENKAKELQDVVDERSAQADELDSLIQVRQGEADKIMNNVSEKIDTMSAGVRQELTGLEGTLQKEVSGLTQNLTQEISQSTEKTRQMFEAATKNLIDQNTKSLEGLKDQLEQLGQLDQIGELSTEMNTTISTLKTDIADKIHAEDVKCYRNIQASMDEQSKLLAEGDEKTRQHVRELMESLDARVKKQSRLGMVTLVFSVLDFVGILGIVVLLLLL
jgi:hypothetical protein